jgi:N-acetylglutamate synthase-like GNAT family acetyltransferase
MEIKLLADHPNFVSKVAFWSYNEWNHLFPLQTYKDALRDFSGYLNRERLPLTFIVIENNEVIGTASLVQDDELPGYGHLTPWIASVYVTEENRGRGIGRLLVRHSLKAVKRLGIRFLYLWTENMAEWYAKQGWTEISKTCLYNLEISIMQFDIRILSMG